MIFFCKRKEVNLIEVIILLSCILETLIGKNLTYLSEEDIFEPLRGDIKHDFTIFDEGFWEETPKAKLLLEDTITKIIKENSMDTKKEILEHLWKIVISDKTIDQFESNLLRRICGLIYVPDKISAEIKLKLLNTK